MKNGKNIDEDGITRYYKNDKLHRVNGPAEDDDSGYKSWWRNGRLHREDGPAIEYIISDFNDWYYYGIEAKNEKQFYNKKWRAEILLDLI